MGNEFTRLLIKNNIEYLATYAAKCIRLISKYQKRIRLYLKSQWYKSKYHQFIDIQKKKKTK